MDIEKNWFSEMAGRKITVIEIAKLLDVSRNTARTRLDEGLSSDELIKLARALHINPVIALQELNKVTLDEVFNFLDSDGTLLATATTEQLIYHLAQSALSLDEKQALVAELQPRKQPVDELEQRRKSNSTVSPESYDLPDEAVAYPHEELGGSLDDLDS